MAFNLGDVFVTFKAKTESLDKGLQSVKHGLDNTEKNLHGFSGRSAAIMGAVAGVAQSVFTRATDMIGNSVGDAIKRVDTLNNASRTFENMGFAAADSAKAMEALKKSILGLPTPLDRAVSGMQLIASTTGNIGKAQEIFSALNNAILGFGGNAAMVDSAVVQMSQDFAAGRITGQTWLSMMNSGLGPALNALAKKMGITTDKLREGLSDGTISVAQFQDALIEMNKSGGGGLKSFEKIAKDSTAGIGTGFENMKTAVTRGMAKIIETIGSENISGTITGIGKFFESALKFVAGFIEGTVNFLKGIFKFFEDNKTTIENLAIAITGLLLPAIVAIGVKSAIAFGIYLANLAATVTATTIAAGRMALSWLLAFGPAGLIAGAIIALTALIIANWDTVKGWLSSFWSWIKEAASSAGDWIKGVFGGIGDFFSGIANGIKNAWGSVVNFFRDATNKIGGFFSSIGDAIASPFKAAFNAVSGFWNKTIGKLNFKVPSWVPGIGGKGFEMPSLPALALGTGNWPGGLVGAMNEFGPETAVLPKGTRVITADQTRRDAAGGQNVYNIHLKGVMARSESELADIMESAIQTLDRRLMGAGKPQILGGKA